MKISYEEWRKLHTVEMADDVRDALESFHAIDAEKEVEEALRKEYEFYANGGYDK